MAHDSPLNVDRLQRLNSLLDEALALAPDLRDRWLLTLPSDYADLAPTLRNMLAQRSVETHAFLSRPVAVQELIARGSPDVEDESGATVGPYRLLRQIGAGGMGTVWLADRTDGVLTRRVALKLPRTGWAPGLGERMRRERDILASLEHPHIARLYDAGLTEDGRPFMALEYVEGKPIDRYCLERHAGVKECLRLFLQVADAVSHAHARLIVHRDIKPGNILVTDTGEVRLLDFGVAKLLVGEEGEGGVPDGQLTSVTGAALTIDYASPEQIRSERITVASDVYSLGVVLFELLTGARPYKPKRRSAGALEDAIAEQNVPLASSVADRANARSLRGDLDTILAKALKKSLLERYPSVEAFASDVKRFIAGEPVLAQKDSAWYRTRKFVTRHVGAVASSALVMIAILVGGGVAIWQAKVARAEAERAAQVKTFIASIFTQAIPRTGAGGVVTAADLLTAAALRIDQELATQPSIAAELGGIVGSAFMELGEEEKGRDALKSAIARGEAALGPQHRVTVSAKLVYAQVLARTDAKASLALIEATLPDAVAALPGSAEDLVFGLRNKATLHARFNEPAKAYASMKEAIAVGEKHLGLQDRQTIYSIGQLSNIQQYFGDFQQQLESATVAVERARRAFAAQRPHAALVGVERWYGDALGMNGRAADAVAVLRQVLEDQKQLDVNTTRSVVFAKFALGRALFRAGRPVDALPLITDAIEYEQNSSASGITNLARYRDQLGQIFGSIRKTSAALHQFQEAAAFAEKSGESPQGRLSRQLHRARIYALLGETENVATALKEAKDDVQIALVRALEARLQGKPSVAVSLLSAIPSAEIAKQSVADRSAISAELGLSYLDAGNVAAAAVPLKACLDVLQQAQVALSVANADCQLGNARLFIADGRAADAEATLTVLVQAWLESNPDSIWHGEALYWLAKAQAQSGKPDATDRSLALARPMLGGSSLPALRKLQ